MVFFSFKSYFKTVVKNGLALSYIIYTGKVTHLNKLRFYPGSDYIAIKSTSNFFSEHVSSVGI